MIANRIRKEIPTERQEQIMLLKWASYHPILKDLLFHIPNGGSRHFLEAVNLKRMGVKSGIPDIFLPVARKGKNGLFIEMKRKSTSARITEEQLRMMGLLANQGYAIHVCHGFDESKKVILDYLGGEIKNDDF